MSITKPAFVKSSIQGPQWAKFVDFNNSVQGPQWAKFVDFNNSIQGPQWAKFVDINNGVQWAFTPPCPVNNPHPPACKRQGAACNRPASSIRFGSQ